MTITVRQSAVSGGYNNDTETLPSSPVQGNLLIAMAAERSGGTSWSINGTGWTLAEAVYQSPTNGTYRKSSAIWYKFAGASEPSSITVTNNSGGGDMLCGIAEFESDSGEMALMAFADSVATGSDAVAASYSSGTSPSVASTNKFLIGYCYTKPGSGVENPYSTWNSGLVEYIEFNGGSNNLDCSIALGVSTTTGTHNITASKDVGTTNAERGGIVSLLIFDIASGGGGGVPNTFDAAYLGNSEIDRIYLGDNLVYDKA